MIVPKPVYTELFLIMQLNEILCKLMKYELTKKTVVVSMKTNLNALAEPDKDEP